MLRTIYKAVGIVATLSLLSFAGSVFADEAATSKDVPPTCSCKMEDGTAGICHCSSKDPHDQKCDADSPCHKMN